MKKTGFLAFFLLLLFSAAFAQTKIFDVELEKSRKVDYVTIKTDGYIEPSAFLLENQLVIDFPNAATANKIYSLASRRIKAIRKARFDAKTVRVVIDLKEDIEYDLVNVFGRQKTVIEIMRRRDDNMGFEKASESKNVTKKAPPLEPKKYLPKSPDRALPLYGKTIVLDPGHGGKDPGALSCQDKPEKELTLVLAKKLAEELSNDGAKVYLTRSSDRDVNLKDAVNFANKIQADLFICLHYNSIYKRQVSGIETYFYNDISRSFAQEIHKNLVSNLKRKDRGLRRMMFYTIHHTRMPAVLVEPLYISNPDESYLANKDSYQEEIAQAIVKGVKEYFGSKLH